MGKKVRRSISVLLLALAIAVTQIPAFSIKAENHSEFVIEGTTLISYEGTDVSVSIPNSIEKIGQNAFENNKVVERIVIPDSVEEIESGAFAGCLNLSQINLPASVTEIGSSAFANCQKLGEIAVDFRNEQFQCRDGVLYNKKGTEILQVLAGKKQTTYKIPDSIENIEKYAFWGCENISQIIVGKGMTQIPEYAFSNCKGLQTITIPASVTEIDLKAFEDCVSLEEVYIPPSVVSIHDTAFDGCIKVRFFYEENTIGAKFAADYELTKAAYVDYEESESTQAVRPSQMGNQTVSGNAGENGINDYSASDVSNLDVSTLPDSLETKEQSDVMGKTKIVSSQAVVFLDNTKMQVQSGETKNTELDTAAEDTVLQADENQEPSTFLEEEEIVEKYVIVDGKIVADRAYYKRYDLTDYQIPNGIEKIGDFAFSYTGLTSIEIPYGVKSIGYGAFYKSPHLGAVVIPQTVTTIEPYAFEGTKWIENWKNGPDVNEFLVVGDGILIAYKGTGSHVTLPENVKKIGANAFEGHDEIISVSIPDRVVEIGEDAFKDCTSLKNVSGGNYLEKICDRAFLNCPLETIRIPATVKKIGLRAFDQENGGKSDSVVFLGNTLPEVSYEKTAARFTNDEDRQLSLNSVEVAVINNGINNLQDTILDDKNMGFRGIVCSILKEPSGNERGAVYVQYVSNKEDGYPVTVPEVVWIYGKEYDVEAVDNGAYHDFSMKEEASGTETVQESETETETETESTSNIGLKITHPDYKENQIVAVSFSRNAQDYIVTLGQDKEAEEALYEALEKGYGTVNEDNFLSFDLSMCTRNGGIQIESLGKERLTVTIPVYKTWIDTPIVAVCLDQNGQLEFSSCKQYVKDGEGYVTFEAKHFSPYGLYQGENIPSSFKEAFDAKIAMRKGAEYHIEYGRKDVSPDTGDYLEPKWLLAAGLLVAALFLLFQKDDKKITIK